MDSQFSIPHFVMKTDLSSDYSVLINLEHELNSSRSMLSEIISLTNSTLVLIEDMCNARSI